MKYKAVKAGTSTKKKAIKASDFAKSAKQLPKALTKAVKRDLGLTGEQYLARAEAAHRAEQVVTALGTGASTRTWLGTDGQLRVLVKNQVGAAVATEQGAVPVTSDPLGDQAAAANAKADGRSYYVDRAAGKVRSYDSSSFRLRDVRNNELEGGDGFLFGMNGGTYRCSLAFAGVGAFGQPVQLTAGHCVEGTDRTVGTHLLDLDAPVAYGEPLSQANVVGKFGWTGPGEIGNDNDGGLLNVQGDYSAAPVVSTWGGGKGSQDDGDDVTVYDSVGAVNGMPVCKSGSTTGWTCGSVVDAETTEVIGDGAGGIAGSVNAFIFDACILSGRAARSCPGTTRWASTRSATCVAARTPAGGLAVGRFLGPVRIEQCRHPVRRGLQPEDPRRDADRHRADQHLGAGPARHGRGRRRCGGVADRGRRGVHLDRRHRRCLAGHPAEAAQGRQAHGDRFGRAHGERGTDQHPQREQDDHHHGAVQLVTRFLPPSHRRATFGTPGDGAFREVRWSSLSRPSCRCGLGDRWSSSSRPRKGLRVRSRRPPG